MKTTRQARPSLGTVDDTFSAAERQEMRALGILDDQGRILLADGAPPQVPRQAVSAPGVLNEAFDYPLPSSFTRGLVLDLRAGQRILWISGTASVNEVGDTVHPGDLRAQTWRTYRNITELLRSAGATWSDIVRTTCYLRDIERDYDEFNKVRTLFYRCMNLNPLPASTGIQVRLCRSDLLIEIEAFAVLADGQGS